MSNRKITVSACTYCAFLRNSVNGYSRCWLGGPGSTTLWIGPEQAAGLAPPPQGCELRRRGIRVVLELTEVP